MTGPGGIRGPGGFGALRSGQIQGDEARLRASSSLLESEFMTTLFRAMRDTVPQESPGADGAQDIFWSMLEREVADQAAMGGGYGLGDAIHRALSPGAEGGVEAPPPPTREGIAPPNDASAGPPALHPVLSGRMNLHPFGESELG
ncbi:MAG: hypothetical protein EA350_09405 [Gemmatimonadales bacterium]|nr:MAG: hypothetical protein EA350_09405 [Gemmatimonadales bacterium]